MINSDHVRIKKFLLLLGLMLFWGACSQATEPETHHKSNAMKPSMDIKKKIPPIDVAAPSKFETASFGLG